MPRHLPRFGHLEVFALVAAGSFLAARFLPVLDLPYACPFKAWLGLPCASCGMTRAFVHLARGDLAGAWAMSPLGAALAGLAWAFAVAALARAALDLPVPAVPSRAGRWAAGAAVAAVLINWGWLLWSVS